MSRPAPPPLPTATERPDPYAGLDPTAVLDALDTAGWRGDGRVLQLNSFENRVWLVHLEDGGAVVAKFYRPGRWSDAQIEEEHAFTLELAQAEVPVAQPLAGADGRTLHHTPALMPHGENPGPGAAPWRFAVFDRRPGRGPELEQPGVLMRIGHFLGRLHAVGMRSAFHHRPSLGLALGHDARTLLRAGGHLTPAEAPAWNDAADRALGACEAVWQRLGEPRTVRLHGDCHLGNILWTEAGPHFVDLDDAMQGPAVQDLWMLLSADDERRAEARDALLEGYEAFIEFDPLEWRRVEVLRTLRMLHHSAWIARRWHDPAFPAAFPWFGTPAYWNQQTVQLREQIEQLERVAERPG